MKLKKKIKNIVSFLLHGNPDIVTANVVTMAPSELLRGRCALITGGTSGIGLAIARAFLNAGAEVIITGRSRERLDKACTQLSTERCHGFVMDNTRVDTFEDKLSKMLQFVNRGGQGRQSTFWSTMPECWAVLCPMPRRRTTMQCSIPI